MKKQKIDRTDKKSGPVRKVSNEKAKWTLGAVILKFVPWIMAVFLCIAAFSSLYKRNADVLFMAQMHSLFVSGGEFFSQCMQRPGGLLQWGGLFLTQLFYNTWIGVVVLAAIWLLTFALLKRAFRLHDALSPLLAIPIVCLLVSVIDLGYWIYYMRLPGYFFRESLGFLAVACLLNVPARSRIPHLLAALAYPLIGYYSVVALGCLVVRNAFNRRWIDAIVSVMLLVVAPILFRSYYSTMRTDETYTVGFPEFSCLGEQATDLVVPFYVAIAVLLLLPVLQALTGKHLKAKGKVAIATAVMLATLVTAGSTWALRTTNFDDENFHAECKAYRAIDEQRWDDALGIVSSVKGDVTRELIIFKNIALFNTGDIGNKMYSYKDTGVPPNVPLPLRVSLAELAAPLIYLNHGQTYYAYRWCMENNVVYGETVMNLKIMALSAMVNGDSKVAEKYLDILSRTLYYKEWAEKYRALLRNPKEMAKTPELRNICEAHANVPNETRSDNSLCEKFIIETYSRMKCPNSLYMSEMTMAYALISKDIGTFWDNFSIYATLHKDKEMPVHYQEAAFLYGFLEPQTVDVSKMPFDQERVVKRFGDFWQTAQRLLATGLTTEAVAESTEADYGDTFWWSYYFDRNSKYY